jgi:hypothetical protein
MRKKSVNNAEENRPDVEIADDDSMMGALTALMEDMEEKLKRPPSQHALRRVSCIRESLNELDREKMLELATYVIMAHGAIFCTLEKTVGVELIAMVQMLGTSAYYSVQDIERLNKMLAHVVLSADELFN